MKPQGVVLEQAQNFKATLRQLVSYLKRYLPFMLVALLLCMGGTVFQFLGPDKLRAMTDEIIKGLPTLIKGETVIGVINLNVIKRLGWILIFFYTMSAVLGFIENYMMATVAARIGKQMRSEIAHKINCLPFKYFDQTKTGDVLSRITNDVDLISHALNQSLDTLVRALTMLTGSLVMMFYTSPLLALTTVLATAVGFILMILIMKKSQPYFQAQQQELGVLNGYIEEIYSNHLIVKAYNGGEQAQATFNQINESLFKSNWKAQFMSSLMMPLMGFIGNFGYVVVCVAGSVLVLKGSISFGVIVAFMLYVRFFTQPFSQLAQAAQSLQRTVAAGERVFSFLGETELSDESHLKQELKDVKGDVSFKNVDFGYHPGKPVIKNFSVTVKRGEKVAIVGPTGAGKTTLVNLLMRFYEVDQGSIYLDGIDLKQVTRENVHAQFGMVLQDTWLFKGTIKENIIYSKIGVTSADVITACKEIGLHHFIQTLPQGYETVLNENINLAAGQKQLITIARAMIQNAPLLILDEATSSVDTRTEGIVQAAMEKLTQGRTSFVIAHRLSTIQNADLIIVMQHGNIVEKGTHQALLAKAGYYAKLYYSQFK